MMGLYHPAVYNAERFVLQETSRVSKSAVYNRERVIMACERYVDKMRSPRIIELPQLKRYGQPSSRKLYGTM